MSLRTCVAGGCCFYATLVTAEPIPIYQNDFESGVVGQEWSAAAKITSAPIFTKYLGRYAGNEGVVLTLDAVLPPLGDGVIVPPNDGGDMGGDGGGGDGGDGGGGGGLGGEVQYTLTFDIYAIDSWDGNPAPHGPDAFRVEVNGDVKFQETIANQHHYQTMREPDVGRTQLGYASYNDSIYRDVAISFVLPDDVDVMKIKFRGVGLQALHDESWGIDNVRVNYDIVPSPGAGVLAITGLLVLARRRRT